MATLAKRQPKVTLSREVKAFARERGLMPHLPAILDVLCRVFSDANRIVAEVHEDPEIADLRWLLFEVEVPWKNSKRALQAREEWHDALAALCPAPLLNEMILLVRRRP